VVGHEGQREGAREGDGGGEGSCKKVDYGNGESSKDQRDDSKVSFGFGERIELVGENEEEGRMKEAGVPFVKFYLVSEVIPGVIEGVDFIHPEGFLVKGIESKGKPNEKAEKKDK
jgi:hypothetical protein